MRIKKLNEQFAQTFSGDGFNSSNGVFKVKYLSYDDLSQARGREINPYDHVKGEEFQSGDIVLVKLKSGKGRKKIEAVIVSSSRSEDGKSLSFKIRSLNTNKIHSVPVHAIEFAQDRGHVNTERGKSGSTISNKQKFLTSLKYNAGNFIWGSLESKKNNLKSDILLNESGSNIERPGLIDPSIRIVLINSANPDYQTHIENFKKLGILYSIPEEKTIFINKEDPNFSKLTDNHLLVIEALEIAKFVSANKQNIDEKFQDVLAAQILRKKGLKEAYKTIASNFIKKHGVSYGECADSMVPEMNEYLLEK
jgi:hypothetical protein